MDTDIERKHAGLLESCQLLFFSETNQAYCIFTVNEKQFVYATSRYGLIFQINKYKLDKYLKTF